MRAFLMLHILLLGSVHVLHAQPSAGATSSATIIWDRQVELDRWNNEIREKSEDELIDITSDSTSPQYSRVASAVLLLRERHSQKGVETALQSLMLELPPGINESESAGYWGLAYPVAGEAANHVELMSVLIESGIEGSMPESLLGFVLRKQQLAGAKPIEYLEGALKRNLTPEQKLRCHNLLAKLEDRNAPKSQEPDPSPLANPISAMGMPLATPPDAPIPSHTSALPWLLGGAAVVLVSGLFWFLRRRAKGA